MLKTCLNPSNLINLKKNGKENLCRGLHVPNVVFKTRISAMKRLRANRWMERLSPRTTFFQRQRSFFLTRRHLLQRVRHHTCLASNALRTIQFKSSKRGCGYLCFCEWCVWLPMWKKPKCQRMSSCSWRQWRLHSQMGMLVEKRIT